MKILTGFAHEVRRAQRLIAISLAAGIPGAAAAQGASVAGRTVDSTSRAPMPLVTVVLVNAATHDTLSGTLTGADGRFLIRGLAPGRYTIATRYPGVTPAERSVLVSTLNLSYDLGDILIGRLQTLAGVNVTADAIRTAALNTEVHRIDQGATPTTGSVLDALKNVTGVTVDQEGKVLLRGSDRVAVLIDGRPSSLTGLGNNPKYV
ncbi:MAG: carboxypeptidase regulatory-like domain-containing protein [Gemmatimonadaceae bacterium]|nr:carboxypeptidase regulatory-like domain-containing protein [Gemmatimonadaceae bacterium]